MEGAGTRQPGLVVEADHIHHQGVTLPAPDRIAHVAREEIVRMLRVQRNHSKEAHVLIKKHDLLRRVDDLYGKERHIVRPRQPGRETVGRRIVDAPPVERLHDLFGGPRLIRRRLGAGWPFRGGRVRGGGRIDPCSAHAQTRVGLLPCSTLLAAALPNTRQIRLPIGGARDRAFRLSCPCSARLAVRTPQTAGRW